MKRISRARARRNLYFDFLFILGGAAIAVILSASGAIAGIIAAIGNNAASNFLVGIFFTSSFTIVPASIVLVQMALAGSVTHVAFWGALGAACGDTVIFLFIRDRFIDDLQHSFRPSFWHRLLSSFHLGFLKWITPVLGAVALASPLPDDVGLALLGLSRASLALLIPVSFIMNLINLYIIVYLAQAF